MVLIVAGGIAIGAGCGGAALIVAWRSSEHLIEAALTMVAAYGSFLVAESLHVSGVLATVTAGLMMANFHLLRGKASCLRGGRNSFSASGILQRFSPIRWSFFSIGAAVAAMPFQSYGAILYLDRCCAPWPRPDGISARLLFLRSRWAISLREQHILWWGGLRGALALALALSMPPTLPLRDEIAGGNFCVHPFHCGPGSDDAVVASAAGLFAKIEPA